MDTTAPPPDSAPERSPRLRLALGLFLLDYVFGWPVVAAAAPASPWIGASNAALIGSVSYAFSWVLLGAASLIGGAQVAVVGRAWIRGLLRR